MGDPIIAAVTNDARKYLPMFLGMKIPRLASVPASDPSGVHAAHSADGSNTFPGPFRNPDFPRIITVTFQAGWDGGNVTVVGTDRYGAALSETFTSTPGSTVVGITEYKTIISASKTTIGATTNTASIGLALDSLPDCLLPGTPLYGADGDAWNPLITHFRVGEGGWIYSGGSDIPRTPDADLRRATALTGFDAASYYVQDIDAVCDKTRGVWPNPNRRYPDDSLSWYEKALLPADITYDAGTYGPTTIRIKCTLTTSEYNTDGYGYSPEIWELGIFCAHPRVVNTAPVGYPETRLMLAYGTFPKVTKTSSIEFTRYVHITF